MAPNSSKCNHLTPLPFKGLRRRRHCRRLRSCAAATHGCAK